MRDLKDLYVQTETRGRVPGEAIDLAVERVRAALRAAHEPVLFARVRLTAAADPAVERPAIAQVNIDLNGRPIRVQAVAATMRQAIDGIHDGLGVRLEHAARDWEAIRGREPSAVTGEWRHQSRPTARAPYYPRPPEERTVIRRKSYALGSLLPEDAVAEMNLLDYDFHLFTERETGQDSVVYRSDDEYRLAQVDPRPDRLAGTSITVSAHPAPVLTLSEAADRLDALGQPFLFFVDEATGRGNLIYHRYDGHYGLIAPAEG